jgi:hypothetical protein
LPIAIDPPLIDVFGSADYIKNRAGSGGERSKCRPVFNSLLLCTYLQRPLHGFPYTDHFTLCTTLICEFTSGKITRVVMPGAGFAPEFRYVELQ